ncbi:serine hydrolase domain-containing protein [Actinophytocola sp. NPDC049390]|uniref:serine hydrolase domain-containing protein n=1 Tax=Actinophytocola sp. NPDC049390 TaxID=3363894 RepID=UPI0037B11998
MKSLVFGLVLALTPAPASVDGYLDDALDATGLPGVSVVVTHGDRVVHATGAGHDSAGSPVTADTPMRVASVSKSFTAAGVLTLVEDGRLALDDPVRRWLPTVPGGVTVRHLLNQTSGLADSSVNIGELESTRTLAEYAEVFEGTLVAPPGTTWSYCNVNYDLAARVAEVVSGQPFDEFMADAVFEPLGMHDTAVGGAAADGYNSLFGMWFSRPELDGGPAVNGAGGVVTTAADMGRWLVAQNGHGPFPASLLETMREPSAVDQYGMGWAPADGLLVHSGNLWTYNAVQAIDPSTGYGYAVMTNGAGLYDDTQDILDGLVSLTRGESPASPGGGRQTFEWVLAGIGLLALALAVLGVARARRWSTRRLAQHPGRGRLRWWVWTCLRMVPCLLPVSLLVFYPQVVSFISAGRTVLWAQLFYFALPLTVVVAVAAVAGFAVLVARVWRLRSAW